MISLKNHIARHNNLTSSKDIFKCDINPSGPLKCELCEKEFTAYQSLAIHMASLHKKGDLSCNQCDFVAAFPNLLVKHKEKHGHFPCDKCSFVANLRTELTKHVKFQHTSRLYPCDQCDYLATKVCKIIAKYWYWAIYSIEKGITNIELNNRSNKLMMLQF